jgi:hypothetical protein
VSRSAESKVKASLDTIPAGHSLMSDAQMSAFCASVAELVGAGAVYIAERTGVPTPAGEEVPPGGGARIKYLAVSSKEQDFVRSAVIAEPAGATTLKVWVMPEVPPPEEPVEGEPAKPAPPPPELPVAHVANVLRDPALTFHGVPRPGSYIAAPLQYGCVVHAGALAEGAGPVTAEDGSVTLPAATPMQRSLALCADTMGAPGAPRAGEAFNDEQVAALKRCAGYLKAALERTEAAAFSAEYQAFLAAKPADEQAAQLAALAAEADAAAAAATEAGNADAAALGEAAPEDAKALARGRAMLAATKSVLQQRMPLLESQVAARLVAPKESALKLLQCVWFMLGYRKETLGDAGAPDPLALSWPVARQLINKELSEKIAKFDAEAPVTMLSYAKADVLKGELAGLDIGELNKTGAALGALCAWAKACLEVKEAANAKRAREKAEAEAKAAAEAEAKAAADAAAAAAAAE